MKSDNEVNEAFAKAIGWKKGQIVIGRARYNWVSSEGEGRNSIPNWCQDFPAFKRDVIGRMGKEGYKMLIDQLTVGGYQHEFVEWKPKKPETAYYKAIIKNNEHLRAGVEAATEYFQQRRK